MNWAIGGRASSQTHPAVVSDAASLERARQARQAALLARARAEVPALRAQAQQAIEALRRLAGRQP